MALTTSRYDGDGDVKTRVLSVTFDDHYATGGESLTPAMAGLELIRFVSAEPAAGYVFAYDYTAAKLKVFRSAGFTPAGQNAAHTHDLLLKEADQADGATTRVNAAADKLGANTGGSLTVTGLAAGGSAHGGVVGLAAGSPAFTGTAVVAAALVEVAVDVDLSALVTRVLIVGR